LIGRGERSGQTGDRDEITLREGMGAKDSQHDALLRTRRRLEGSGAVRQTLAEPINAVQLAEPINAVQLAEPINAAQRC
jgi:hypothetical protein